MTTSNPSPSSNVEYNIKDKPYLKYVYELRFAFPPFQSFISKIGNVDQGRKLVLNYYQNNSSGVSPKAGSDAADAALPDDGPETPSQNQPTSAPEGVPGRCYCMEFAAEKVTVLKDYPNGFATPTELAGYLADHPAKASRKNKIRRLFVLEDLEPRYIDVLGQHLDIDPLVFSEQMNTWNFTDSNSIPHRGLPSLCTPKQSFTLRYYEIRTLADAKSIDALTLQFTFAVNRRRYERWRDIDLPLSGIEDKRQAFIRRCASFWSSQDPDNKEDEGWDALILVDPGMARVKVDPEKEDTTFILKDPRSYDDRAGLWNAPNWTEKGDVEMTEHKSTAYHNGCPTLAQVLFSHVSNEAQTHMQDFQQKRDLASPLDEQILYWTKIASKSLIKDTLDQSSNAAYYLLKHVAQHWTNQLELINSTVARGEYLSDDYQATINDDMSHRQWKNDLIQVNLISKDINYMRRQMNHFWRAMILNLERLDIQLGSEQVNNNLPPALRDAQKDLLTINARMQLLRERTEALTAIANDLANLRAAFRGVHDSEFGLRLSLFASVVFPLTLVAGIFSMNDSYLPGAEAFWKFWAVSLPFVAAFALVLVYGWRPYRVVLDLKEYGGILFQKWVPKTKKRVDIKNSGGDRGLEEQTVKANVVERVTETLGPKKRTKWHNSLC